MGEGDGVFMQDRSTAGYGIGVFPSLAVDLLGWRMLWSAKKFAYLQVGKWVFSCLNISKLDALRVFPDFSKIRENPGVQGHVGGAS